jgi:(1->4)-alpha-D-glucan 1-alpha-D-glucosylmutase
VLKLDEAAGELAVWAYDTHKLPLCPLTYGEVLGDLHPTLENLGDEFGALREWRPQVARRAAYLKRTLAAAARDDAEVRGALAAAVERVNRPDDGVRRALDGVIAKQYWRAAHFRVAGDDINYRRFFNINDLAGLRIELPEVFEHVHGFVLELLRKGVIDGLRIDHIDGLLEPRGYLERLRRTLAEAGVPDCYIVVEKILARGETLPESWPVSGTTGYEFGSEVLQALVDPASEAPLTRLYRHLTDEREPFAEVVRAAKLKIMRNEMASEVNVLARDAARVARQNPRTADFTHGLLRTALRELIAGFPVYRTYVDGAGRCTKADLEHLGEALAAARRYAAELDPSVFAFLARLLTGKLVEAPRSGFSRTAVLRCAMKVQQLSGPIMAKGLEDTAFYRYHRFIGLNEVGGQPQRIGGTVDEFHAANLERARRWPHGLSATATHDTKRGEDSRARLAVLTEVPEDWAQQVAGWRQILRGAAPHDGAPDANDEYYFYQSLLGAWPAELCDSGALDERALAAFGGRLRAAMIKAVREAKRHTTWAAPDERYEAAVVALVENALGSSPFLGQFVPFASRIARLGVHSSLVQLTLKLTAPGVPDIYQGTETWDLSLVDPDNRRRVDFAHRAMLLESVDEGLEGDRVRMLAQWLREWHDGRIKVATMRVLLALRARAAELFASGVYEPCAVTGPRADELIAYVRRHERNFVVTAVQRFPVRAERAREWRGTRIRVPGAADGLVDVLTGRTVSGDLDPAELFTTLPVAVLERSATHGETSR